MKESSRTLHFPLEFIENGTIALDGRTGVRFEEQKIFSPRPTPSTMSDVLEAPRKCLLSYGAV